MNRRRVVITFFSTAHTTFTYRVELYFPPAFYSPCVCSLVQIRRRPRLTILPERTSNTDASSRRQLQTTPTKFRPRSTENNDSYSARPTDATVRADDFIQDCGRVCSPWPSPSGDFENESEHLTTAWPSAVCRG